MNAPADEITSTHFCDCWVLEQVRTHEGHAVAGWSSVPEILGKLSRPHQDSALAAIVRTWIAGLVDIEVYGSPRHLLVRVVR